MLPIRRPVALALLLLAGAPGAARAGEPIMPLSEVRAGMRCQGASVVRGVAVSTFDVEVIDIIVGDAAARAPYILFRAEGPAIDRTGIGPGFSGSPIRCPGADGTPRIAGAISEGIGEFGGKTALATPIESVLGEPVDVPVSARSRPDLVARARPISEPMSFGGLSPRVASAVQSAARRVKRVVYATPAPPSGAAFPAAPMVPGSAMAVGLSSGDITSAAVGTVSYVDGDRLWAFGHPLDSAGRRSLFLQDAYVYTVVNNPLGTAETSTYKYAAPGRTIGTLTSDGISAVAGRLGPGPPSYPMKIVALDVDRKKEQVANVQIADETRVGLPVGSSPLTQVGGVALAQMAYSALQGAPARQSSEMCAKIGLLESPGRPLRFCNTYVGGGGGVEGLVGGPLVADFTEMVRQLDAYKFGPLRVSGVEVYLRLRRDLRQGFLLSASGPASARRGSRITTKLEVRRVDGEKLTRTVRLKVPLGMPRGRRTLLFTGTSADVSDGGQDALATVLDLGALLEEGEEDPEGEAGPRTLNALRANVASIHRYDGVSGAFLLPGQVQAEDERIDGAEGMAQRNREVYRDPELRLSGKTALSIVVR
ncbi:MAG: hypothetical protein AVDCRST_MAG53-2631 [uncultured Solirubrobacteraceae bacterium]|uniref:Peptidase S55 domain-containing protein n=1 Tax=uncultured Solirubrobacteraceae bacterium TaxID=1162706 RepID=A0A6J4T2A3_9ACTN|nr:MAG: hypothetical protein AVDCRST_MAG53-2631 [uncultured Solirubrobacteraceae bacterium]